MPQTENDSCHVVFVTLVDPTGASGQNIYSREIAVALSKRNDISLSLICPKPANELPPPLRSSKLTTKFLPTKQPRSIRWHAASQKPLYDALTAIHQKCKIDGIVTTLKPSLITPPIFSRKNSIKQILLVEGMMSRNIREMNPFPGSSTLANVITTVNASTSYHIYTAYTEAQEWVQSLPFVTKDKVSIFHHGVNTDEMDSMSISDARNQIDVNLQPNHFILGFVGSFKSYHRLDLLVDAAASLRSKGCPVHLLFIGTGPQLDAINKRCADRGIKDSVTFTGFVEHELINQYICACNALYGVVDPDHWGSPMKVYEYLACGRPVIAFNSDELKFIETQDMGSLVSEMSVNNVVQATEKIINHSKEKRLDMGANGREYIVNHRTWDALADRIVGRLRGDEIQAVTNN
ncbi:glycosyltransferase family 4 protein [Halosegnis rubeus]|uniref:Glycosyltransferase n=1 Tax=Halosegnis rubeus TaxID=2212850 RepID=A0A5N5UGW6_9EURY|nr:glycosyltransferase family 4 protein [Halosegnis rubeus]KAB7517976.1 glycosyltransferase [Halosegnis rubeus]